MQVIDRANIRLRVYERGAGETLACGTGACAAVVAGRRRGLELGVPLELTLSCMNPVADGDAPPLHCGRCSKCRERRDAFTAIGRPDPAGYAAASPR